jgi:hypothetical protein
MPKIGITAPGQHSSKNLSNTRVLSGKTIRARSNPLDVKQYLTGAGKRTVFKRRSRYTLIAKVYSKQKCYIGITQFNSHNITASTITINDLP